MQKMTEKVVHWIRERERIRQMKELGRPKPWTDDVILSNFRFCNVHREDDKVTEWIATHWRTLDGMKLNGARIMAVARFINHIHTLEEIGAPLDYDEVISEIHYRQMKGYKAFGSAYIVSTNGRRMDKADYIIGEVCASVPEDTELLKNWDGTLAQFHRRLMMVNGLGSFMAGQIIADLKNTEGHALRKATDWWTWAAPGPGSKRGLKRYNPEWSTASTFLDELQRMAKEVWPSVEAFTAPLCMQDWQNVMCEFDKYMRAFLGEGRPKQNYP